MRRPEEMSGFMIKFGANLICEYAFIWALSLTLFYRQVYLEVFLYTSKANDMLTPQWVILAVVGVFIIAPIRSMIKRCYQEPYNDDQKTYE